MPRSTLTGIIVGLLIGLTAPSLLAPALARPPRQRATPPDNAELARLHQEDQADRTPPPGKEIDWNVVGPRDTAREARVKALYQQNALRTAADYHHAAMVLQHAPRAEDTLLAHEFCVVALALAEPGSPVTTDARWLAAAAEDRFLMRLERPQRFGTQYTQKAGEDRIRLHPVDAEVTDGLRAALGVPSLERSRQREAELNRPAHAPR
jgi:hypothetical protein